ncbi:MAG: DHA2 family efflux MFS transporter permease subunit [Bryobacterales bacterium]|nr:DHA2 family efflux MFS transporter permease subunit [Bryobacteraceae bacterium]MDW8131135.1 DHA2 family efflux MFS transporter permease subunit [Bryobacterales bacterium]
MGTGSQPPPLPIHDAWRPRASPWLVAASVVLATFMQVLDVTVIMVALPHIAGGMAATSAEATWTLTSYLVANGIVIPMSGWLALRFGRRRLVMFCTAVFTFASMVCGLAPNLTVLVLARILQGAGSGAMVPAAQAVLLESFPLERRGMAMGLFGLVVVLAPIVGPTLGGWLTDAFSWRWTFYINLPVGLLALHLMARYLEDPPWICRRQAARLDAAGLSSLVLWIGPLQIVLDKGQQADWFASRWVAALAVVSLAAAMTFVVHELRALPPMVDLRVFRDRNFATGTVAVAVLSWVLLASGAMLPQFLQILLGYTAELSGWASSPRGLGVLLVTPVAGYLTSRWDARKLAALGFLLMAAGNYMLGQVNLQIAMESIVAANLVQGMGMGFIFAPLTTLAMATLRNEQMGNASGLFNLVRNVAGGIGISATTTYILRSAQRRQLTLVAHLTPYDAVYQQRMARMKAALSALVGAPQAESRAHAAVYGLVLQQAHLAAYVEAWRRLALGALLGLPALAAMQRVLGRGGIAGPGE